MPAAACGEDEGRTHRREFFGDRIDFLSPDIEVENRKVDTTLFDRLERLGYLVG